MIPVINSVIADIAPDEEVITSSLTFRIDYDKKVIQGMIDEAEALKQSVFCRLMTIRGQLRIYDENEKYGLPLFELLGQSAPLVYVLLTNCITETLLRDDRIRSVTDFVFDTDRKAVTVSFTVNSVFGNINFEEVSL